MDSELERILRTGDQGSQLVARTLALLYLSATKSGTSIRDLAEAADIPVPTTYRIISQLRQAGFVIEGDGAIHASPWLTDSVADENEHLVIFAAPYVRALAVRSGMSAVLTVRVNTLALTLDVVHAGRFGKPVFRVGSTRSLHAGASATPLLAFSAPEVIERVRTSVQKKYTSQTPSGEKLLEKVQNIKSRGYDHTNAEAQAGWSAVGVPVLYGSSAVACLSLVAPSSHMPKDVDDLVNLLKHTSKELSEKLATSNTRFIWDPTSFEDNDNEEI